MLIGKTCAPLAALVLVACAPKADAPAILLPDTAVAVVTTGGFEGPEAVKYDPDQDVFFVSNFGAGEDGLDNNGFISRLRADGTIDSLRFIAGGRNRVTLHMPRGMTIHGDTLWVVDADALRGFDRRTGRPLASVQFAMHRPGFLNDAAIGGDGAIYVTDTGERRVYRIEAGRAEVAVEARNLPGPNGIAWDSTRNRFFLMPWDGGRAIYHWMPGSPATTGPSASGDSAKRFDGAELIADDSLLAASQGDSIIYLFNNAIGFPWIKVKGRPADIAWAPRHRLVAVPYISRDTVEFFRLP